MHVCGRRYVVLPSKMTAGLCRTAIARTVRAIICRVQAPGNPAWHFFVAGRFAKVFCQIPKIARFRLGNFCRRVPRAKIQSSRESPVRVAGRPSGHLIISPLNLRMGPLYSEDTSRNLFTIIISIFNHYLQSYEFPRQNVLERPIGFVSLFERAFR